MAESFPAALAPPEPYATPVSWRGDAPFEGARGIGDGGERGIADRDAGRGAGGTFARRASDRLSNFKSFRIVPAACALLLLWPALWNGYPIVFADTGTYLYQAMHRSLGWDRPAYYSLAIYPFHLGVATGPVVAAQAALAMLVLDLTRRGLGLARGWLPALTVFLAIATWFPWLVSELMPDLFTPLLVLLLCVLVFAPSRFGVRERVAMTGLATFLIATQQSSVPLSLAILGLALPLRWAMGRAGPRQTPTAIGGTETADESNRGAAARGRGDGKASLLPLLAPVLAIIALLSMNAAGHGRIALSPYGNVFLLARVIYDGPGLTVLRRDCLETGWRLCPHLDRLPPTSDEFLWNADSPILLAGGHKAVSADADAIIRTALRAEPGRALRALWDNTLEQLVRFDSGDGLEAWPAQVDPRIDADFPPRERAAYHAARQRRGTLALPPVLAAIHRTVALAGIVAALLLLPRAWKRRREGAAPVAGFLTVALLTLPLSAAITGGLSTPHDRYQSRVAWLPACAVLLGLPVLFPRRRPHGLVVAGPWTYPRTPDAA